jgi:hypothetical protein
MLQGEPILIHTVEKRIDAHDLRDAYDQDLNLCGSESGPCIRISDVRAWDPDFSQMMIVMAEIARQKQTRGDFEANILDLAVSEHEIVIEGMESMSQSQYGSINIMTFGDMESALDYARDQLGN